MRKGGGDDGWLRLRLIVRGGSLYVFDCSESMIFFVCKTRVGAKIFVCACGDLLRWVLLINFRGTACALILHDRVPDTADIEITNVRQPINARVACP